MKTAVRVTARLCLEVYIAVKPTPGDPFSIYRADAVAAEAAADLWFRTLQRLPPERRVGPDGWTLAPPPMRYGVEGPDCIELILSIEDADETLQQALSGAVEASDYDADETLQQALSGADELLRQAASGAAEAAGKGDE